MTIPTEHRAFLRELGKISLNTKGDDVLIGLSLEETEEWLRLTLDRDLAATVRRYELNQKHQAAMAFGKMMQDMPVSPGSHG